MENSVRNNVDPRLDKYHMLEVLSSFSTNEAEKVNGILNTKKITHGSI